MDLQSLLGGNNALYQLVVTVIQYGTESGVPQTDYLLEDALKLWARALKHMTTINDDMLSVFPLLARSLTQQELDQADCMKVTSACTRLVISTCFLTLFLVYVVTPTPITPIRHGGW